MFCADGLASGALAIGILTRSVVPLLWPSSVAACVSKGIEGFRLRGVVNGKWTSFLLSLWLGVWFIWWERSESCESVSNAMRVAEQRANGDCNLFAEESERLNVFRSTSSAYVRIVGSESCSCAGAGQIERSCDWRRPNGVWDRRRSFADATSRLHPARLLVLRVLRPRRHFCPYFSFASVEKVLYTCPILHWSWAFLLVVELWTHNQESQNGNRKRSDAFMDLQSSGS